MDSDHQSSTEAPRVAMDAQIVFSQRDVGPQTRVIAHHPTTGKYFQFGPEEYRVASLLDGHRSPTEILRQLERDGVGWEPQEVADFIAQLVASGLASPVGSTNPGPSSQTASKTWFQRLPSMLSLMVSQRIPLINGHEIASKLERRVGEVFSNTGILVWSVLVASGLIIVAAHRHDFADELRRMFDPGLWLVLLVMWAAAKVVHEAGHAIAARYHGVHVGKIGIMFFFCAPLAYVDVTDAWKLKSRWTRVQIALAGVYLELAIAAVAAWAWWFLPGGMAKHLAAQVFLVAGPATLLVNANPLLRLDGYYVLSDLTEIPNLRMHGRRQLVGLMERLLLNIEPPRPMLSGWQQTFATVHAICSVIFQVVWMSGLIIGVSMWASGLGVLLAVAATLLWGIIPLAKWSNNVWSSEPGGRWYLNEKRKRLLCSAGILLIAFQYLCATHSPMDRRVPVIVQFRHEQIARASADAFVHQVYVARGQRVSQGMLLVELEDPQLLVAREQKADDLRLAEHRAIQFRRQGELSKSAAETENAKSLRRQLVEMDGQIKGLDVIAQREGLVISPGIESLEGRFVSRGDELLRVSDPQQKELLASVSENDMQAYQAAATRGVPTRIRLRGGTTFSATPASLRPRARRSLPHPALAATVGGPLPVEPSPNEDELMRVIEPQLESRTPLDPITSIEVRAGQIGTMTISDNRSLVRRAIEAVTR